MSNEIKGIGNSYTAEFWEYDPRVGRRWNTDPLPKTHESPYSAFGGNPILNIDPTGADTININNTTTRRKFHSIGGGLDGVAAKKIPDQITRSGNIEITAAEGNDVFRITNTEINIDEDGNQSGTSSTTTLNLNNWQTFGRTGGHNMEGYLDDRHALAANAPGWLLNQYANKSGDIGIKSAIALQRTAPFAGTLQKITNTAYVISGAYGIARMTISMALPASAETGFFIGTKYTDKVWKQMQLGDFHSFPEGVTAFEKYGIRTMIKGGDGIEREMLKIPGQYGEKTGFFEFIKEADGSINHRVFRPLVNQ